MYDTVRACNVNGRFRRVSEKRCSAGVCTLRIPRWAQLLQMCFLGCLRTREGDPGRIGSPAGLDPGERGAGKRKRKEGKKVRKSVFSAIPLFFDSKIPSEIEGRQHHCEYGIPRYSVNINYARSLIYDAR